MAKIKVRASNPGYPGRWRAGSRHWRNGEEYVVEVVDDPPDGLALKEEEPIDSVTGLSDMTRISRAGLAALKGDSHLSVLEGDTAVPTAIADAALARAKVLASQLEEAHLKLAGLEADNADLKRQLEEAHLKLAGASVVSTDGDVSGAGATVPAGETSSVPPKSDGKPKSKSSSK